MKLIVLVVALAACGVSRDTNMTEQESGGVCTGTSDVCRPVACTYVCRPGELCYSTCTHNRQQDAMCDSLCQDRGGGRCGDATEFEWAACTERCRNDPNGVLCRAQCWSSMPGYCEPFAEQAANSDRLMSAPDTARATDDFCGQSCTDDWDCRPWLSDPTQEPPSGITLCHQCVNDRCGGSVKVSP